MNKSSTKMKRKLKLEIYKRLLNFTCAHPDCVSGLGIEAHHIRPLYKGGEDKFWNLVSLCWHCHRTKKLHSRSDDHLVELYVYKSMHERKILHFEMDEQEPYFKDMYREAVKNCQKLEKEEREAWMEIENVESFDKDKD